MPDVSSQTLLVTGANGHLARIAIDHLLSHGAKKVIGATRDPSKIEDLKARGIEARALDLNDPSTLKSAFAGVDRVLLISTDAIGQRRQQHEAAIDAAEAAGVKHVVYTSAPAANPDPAHPVIAEHFWTEARLIRSALGWSILRNNIYAEVILYGVAQALASGQMFDATNGQGRSYVTRTDAARAAAAALLNDDGHSIRDITGPEPVTQEEIAALLSELSGKPVARVGVTGEQLRAGMVAAGLPAAMADVMVGFDEDAARGYHGVVTSAVEDLTGQAPQNVRDFLTQNRAALAS